jgi:hypothetical protein
MLEDIEPADQEFSDFYQSDVERIRYYMQLYLRARLAKVRRAKRFLGKRLCAHR